MIPEKWLRLQFRRQMKRGFVTNADLDPQPTTMLEALAEPDETFVVRIATTTGCEYWMTNRRVFLRKDGTFSTLFLYKDVRCFHWIYKDFLKSALKSEDPTVTISKAKLEHFDRIEVEFSAGVVVLEGLDQAYLPIFEFLKLLRKS